MPKPLSVMLVASEHSPTDGRMGQKTASALRDAGMAVTWLGPMTSDEQAALPGDIGAVRVGADKGRGARVWLGLFKHLRRLRDGRWIITADLDALGIALVARYFGGRYAVSFDVHEDYLGHVLPSWLNSRAWLRFLERPLRTLIRTLASAADVTYGVNQHVLDRLDISGLVVMNCPPLSFAEYQEESQRGDGGADDGVPKIYHGKATTHHGTEVVLSAVATISESEPVVVLVPNEGRQRIAAPDTLHQHIRQEYGGVHFEIRQSRPYREMPAEYRRCAIGVIAYQGGAAELSLPNRLFEYAAIGLPAVVPVASRPASEIVQKHKFGVVANVEDPVALSATLSALLNDRARRAELSENGRRAFVHELNWEAQIAPLVDTLRAE